MVQSMRSGVMVQSGEQAGCIGCHEDRRQAPPRPRGRHCLALRRAAQPRWMGWHGPAREFNYLAEVQPVFDRHCVRCHDYGKEAGKKLNLAPDRDLVFNTSYNELWRKKYIQRGRRRTRRRPSPPIPGARTPASWCRLCWTIRAAAAALSAGGFRPDRDLDRSERALLSRPTPAPIRTTWPGARPWTTRNWRGWNSSPACRCASRPVRQQHRAPGQLRAPGVKPLPGQV